MNRSATSSRLTPLTLCRSMLSLVLVLFACVPTTQAATRNFVSLSGPVQPLTVGDRCKIPTPAPPTRTSFRQYTGTGEFYCIQDTFIYSYTVGVVYIRTNVGQTQNGGGSSINNFTAITNRHYYVSGGGTCDPSKLSTDGVYTVVTVKYDSGGSTKTVYNTSATVSTSGECQ
jgi:hypothetical protein